MSASPDTLIDGDWSRPDTVGARRFTYPFRMNGDRVAAWFEEDYWQTAATFTPQEFSIRYSAALADFYLMAETPPVYGLANLLTLTRTWSRIPADQVTYGSQVITKPTPSTLGLSGGTVTDYTAADSGSSLGTGYIYGGVLFVNNQVYSRLNASSATRVTPAGGTFTITYGANTTAALNYNDSAATIAAAINGLASVIADGLTVSIGQALSVSGTFQLSVTVGATLNRFTCNAASLTPAGATIAFTFIVSNVIQQISIAKRVTITGHAFSAGLPLMINNSADTLQALLPNGTHWSIVDANTLAIDDENGGFAATKAGQLTRAYTPGTDRVGIKLTQKFYLPGVTSGITTPADIPIPAILLNDADFLTSVIANMSGYQTYDASDLAQWNGWPMYTQTLTSINMADV